jgi:prophage regulatory protein
MAPTRFLRLPEVMHRTGLSRSTLYAMAQAGTFPRPRKITAGASAWIESDVDAWMASRMAA